MDFGSFIEAGTSAVLNEILASTHENDGMAFPSKYEVLFLPPSSIYPSMQLELQAPKYKFPDEAPS